MFEEEKRREKGQTDIQDIRVFTQSLYSRDCEERRGIPAAASTSALSSILLLLIHTHSTHSKHSQTAAPASASTSPLH